MEVTSHRKPIARITAVKPAIDAGLISWAETMTAFARLQREDPISNEDLEQTVLFACYDRRLNQAATSEMGQLDQGVPTILH